MLKNRQVSINFYLEDREWDYFYPVLLDALKELEYQGKVYPSVVTLDQEQSEMQASAALRSITRAIQDLENQKYIATKIELISMKSKLNLICNGAKK